MNLRDLLLLLLCFPLMYNLRYCLGCATLVIYTPSVSSYYCLDVVNGRLDNHYLVTVWRLDRNSAHHTLINLTSQRRHGWGVHYNCLQQYILFEFFTHFPKVVVHIFVECAAQDLHTFFHKKKIIKNWSSVCYSLKP